MPAPELFEVLREETLPLIAPARAALEKARAEGKPKALAAVRELLHKVAGTGAVAGRPHLSQLCKLGEGVAVLALDGDAKLNNKLCDLLDSVLRNLEAELEAATAPLAVSVPASSPPKSVRASEAGRVVVASDENVSAKVLMRMLEDAGFSVRRASLAEAASALPDCEVLVLDVPSKGEPQAVAPALENAQKLKVTVLLTAKGEVPKELAAKANVVLAKPVRPEALDQAVREQAARRLAVAAARARAPTGQVTAVSLKPPQSLKVLIVDDSRVIRGVVREALHEVGVVTFEAADGAEALQTFAAQSPDAVISDLQMPGVDGVQLMRQLRERTRGKRVPILVLSALDDDASRKAGLEAGADAYLVKSIIDGPQLLKALKSAGLPLP